MKRRATAHGFLGTSFALLLLGALPAQASEAPAPIPFVLLKFVSENAAPAALNADDPLMAQATELANNEGARFIRTLMATAHQKVGTTETRRALPIVLKKGGNHAKIGILGDPQRPYLELSPTPNAMRRLFLHEGGHATEFLFLHGKRPAGSWQPLPHTTFAVTTRETALTEGYAIHLEALWGHFGREEKERNYYHRLGAAFGPSRGMEADFYFHLNDLWTYSQSWARYEAVRDGLPAFQAKRDYLREQLQPDRDRRFLRTGGQMIASEGTVASLLFWLATDRAMALGAKPGMGLEQPGIYLAECELLEALQQACENRGPHATVCDVLNAYAARFPEQRERLSAITLDVTHGMTADPAFAPLWRQLHEASLNLNEPTLIKVIGQVESKRKAIATEALNRPEVLWGALGPVLPVKAKGAVLPDDMPLVFDLNACGEAELSAVPRLSAKQREKVLQEAARRPFSSFSDFQHRTGLANFSSLTALTAN